ncbi:ribonuclease HI [Corynebacterium variabile]|uniref:ribonuclease HI n=1 Tax=Corynebacterium variabile TaxID=1727 RepID=UPI001D8D4B44|nr:ribonuclease HI [Corynebacterium variabile]HJG45370.1 ribonuclease HI [Corynebacterium variabile]
MTLPISPAVLASRPRTSAGGGTLICVTEPRPVFSPGQERRVVQIVVAGAMGRMHREHSVLLPPPRCTAARRAALADFTAAISATVAAVLAVDPGARVLPSAGQSERSGWRRTRGQVLPARGVAELRALGQALEESVTLTGDERLCRDIAEFPWAVVSGIGPAPVTVCSDASWSTSRRASRVGEKCFGWVTDSGDAGSGRLPHCPSSRAEYQGIVKALTAVVRRHPGRPVVLLCDSRPALALLRRQGTGREELDRRLIDGSIRTRWVKGHSGVALNDAADRLCLGTRRILEWSDGADPESRLAELRATVTRELAARLLAGDDAAGVTLTPGTDTEQALAG